MLLANRSVLWRMSLKCVHYFKDIHQEVPLVRVTQDQDAEGVEECGRNTCS